MKKYESPKITFTSVKLFEEIANICWANPLLYSITDPTPYNDDAHIVSIKDMVSNGLQLKGNCDSAGVAIRNYLDTHYPEFSDQDLHDIFHNLNGASLHQNDYILKDS